MAEFKQGNTKVDVKDVNVAVYTDWKDGIFRFENQRLEDILTVLSTGMMWMFFIKQLP